MFRNKEYILTIYKEGSFSKAAQKLYISQPSLSASVKRIEDKITFPLFDRSTTPVSLTEAGREYIKTALEIEEKEKNFERYISDYSDMLTGSIRIGGSSLFSSFMLPGMISEFKNKHPNINFEIYEDNTKNLMEKLSLGTLDLIIDNAVIKNENISSVTYTAENLLMAVPADFEINDMLKDFRMTARDIKNNKHLSEKYNVKLADFCKYPFIFLNPENDTGMRATMLFKKHNLSPDVVFYLDQQVTAYNISCSGMGISFVSDTLVKHMDSEPALFYYKLNDEEVTRNIYFYKKNNHYLSNACRKFIESNIK